MSYQIIYGQTHKRPKKAWRWIGATAFSLLLGILFGLRLFGLEAISLNGLIPGDCSVTSGAWNTMLNRIQMGDDLLEAIDVFCRTVVDGAQLG